jgi:AcrR family transcriptional regulator
MSRKARSPTRLETETRAAKERVVLDAAAEVLVRSGRDGFNVRDVGKLAGASTMIVYTLFGGRDELLDRLWLRGLDDLARAFERVPNRSTLAGLGGLARAYRRFALANKYFYLALSGSPRTILPVRSCEAFRILVAGVDGAMQSGLLDRTDAEAVADGLWGLVHGMVSLELGGHFPNSATAERRLMAAGAALLAGHGASNVRPTSDVRE